MWSQNHLQLFAPAPPEVQGAVQAFGKPGVQSFSYWVVTHYPIGISVSGPFTVWHASDTLDANNFVLVTWEPAIGAMKYDVIRSTQPQFPQTSGNHALALNLTDTFYRDEGQALQFYAPAGLPYGAPVSCGIILNNRDYTTPTMEMPCSLRVSTLIFSDGTMQWSAGGGGGGGPNLVAGAGIQFVSSPGPPPTMTISAPAIFTWTQNVNANGFSLNGATNVNSTNVNATTVTATNVNTNCVIFTGAVPARICVDADGCLVFSDQSNAGQTWLDQHGGLHLGAHRAADWSPGLVPSPGLSITSNWPVMEMASQLENLGQLRWVDMSLSGNQHTADIAVISSPLAEPFATRGSSMTFATKRAGVAGAVQVMVIDHNQRVGLGTTSPAYKLDVNGDINVTGQYRVNGVPIGAAYAHVATTPPASPSEGQLWFDSSVIKLFIRYSGAWIGLN